MAIKSSRGITSGKGTPQRLEGQNGDMTVRTSSQGKKLYVKDSNRWHVLNLNIDTLGLKLSVDDLLKDVRRMKKTKNNQKRDQKRCWKMSCFFEFYYNLQAIFHLQYSLVKPLDFQVKKSI